MSASYARRRKAALAAGIGMLGALLCSTAAAQEPQVRLRVGYGVSDNVNHASAGAQRSDFYSIGIDADVRAERPRLEGAFLTDATLHSYTKERALDDDSEVVGSIDGRLYLQLMPERFSWYFEENFGQVRTNAFEADGPRNRENVLVFSTGPRINIPLGGRTWLAVGATVSDSGFEDTEVLDASTTAVNVNLMRAITPASRVSIGVARVENEFDSALDDQEYDHVVVTYDRELSSGSVRASAGSGDVSVGGLSSSTTTMTFGWSRQVSRRAQLTLSGGRRLTDMLQLFRTGGGISGIGSLTGTSGLGGLSGLNTAGGFGWVGSGAGGVTVDRLREILLNPNPVERTEARAQLAVTARRNTFSFSVGHFEDDFELNDALDRDGRLFSFLGTRELSPRWDASVQLHTLNQEFDLFRESKEFYARIRADRTLGRRATLGLAFERDTRSGTAGAFDENRYTATFGYELR